ncbi:CPBP family intramembrane glutamic endopeptidase [Haloparvum sp. PAK95]|uniref:CPBP family intramembrane glutamic endopeptidase n=1 Tax=Haloparvum sp. PAK95 TaxID=3418962 RepID=UPI003D2EBEE2
MSTAPGDDSAVRPIVALVSALGLGAGGLLFGFLLTFVVGFGLVAVAGIALTGTMQIVLGLVFVQGVGCAGVAYAYVRLRPRIGPAIRRQLGLAGDTTRFRIGASLPGLRDVLVVVGGYLVAFGGAIAGSLLVSRFQVDTGTNAAAEMGMENPEILLLLIPASILLIGPGEELLFRGVVQGRLREVFSPAVAIGLASTVFAGLHWFALSGGSPTGNLVALGVLVVPALVFGVSYEYTGNIVVPALIHGVYNATLFSFLYVSITYSGDVALLAPAVETALGVVSGIDIVDVASVVVEGTDVASDVVSGDVVSAH